MDLRLKDISNRDHATKNKSIPEVEKHYTKATLPMDEKRTTAFGLMEIDEAARMVEFAKKFKGKKFCAPQLFMLCLLQSFLSPLIKEDNVTLWD